MHFFRIDRVKFFPHHNSDKEPNIVMKSRYDEIQYLANRKQSD